jgi:hypothetical protein
LGLAGNEESRWKWWVTAGLVVASECRRRRGEGEERRKKRKKTRCVREVREKKKKKKKTGACVECFDFILNLCIFLKSMRCQFMIRGQKNSTFLP